MAQPPPPPLTVSPPLLNSANPWCTTLAQLRELYACPHTGAVTTRTSLLTPFPHDPAHHQFTFFDPATHAAAVPNSEDAASPAQSGSLNTLGYSPHPLADYLSFIRTIDAELPVSSSSADSPSLKPFIISVTGSVAEIVKCHALITSTQQKVRMRLAMEVNLSCPNIPGKPPPAYDAVALAGYLVALKRAVAETSATAAAAAAAAVEGKDGKEGQETERFSPIPIGIKTPPYTYHDQFASLILALKSSAAAAPPGPCPISFITATNTLGSALLVSPSASGDGFQSTLESAGGTGVGGLAGAGLHPLALGNVRIIRGMLDEGGLESVQVIGVGGVEDADGYRRMRAVGASAVGVGTALGRKGVRIFAEISKGLKARL